MSFRAPCRHQAAPRKLVSHFLHAKGGPLQAGRGSRSDERVEWSEPCKMSTAVSHREMRSAGHGCNLFIASSLPSNDCRLEITKQNLLLTANAVLDTDESWLPGQLQAKLLKRKEIGKGECRWGCVLEDWEGGCSQHGYIRKYHLEYYHSQISSSKRLLLLWFRNFRVAARCISCQMCS